jgi:NADPH:quinone reductase-like Zn-dependent oxidoreductase
VSARGEHAAFPAIDRDQSRAAGVDGPAESAAVALNYFVAYQMLHRVARLAAGDRVLVHGASGGVGIALLELARLAGIECYGSASATKRELVRRIGGHPFDYWSQDFREVVAAFPAARWTRSSTPSGAGGTSPGRTGCFAVAGSWSRTGRAPRWSAARPASWREGSGTWSGWRCPSCCPTAAGRCSTRRGAWRGPQPQPYREELASVLRLLADGAIEPVIAKTMPLEQAAAAQRLLEEGSVTGKIVLVTDPERSQR